MNFAHIEDDGTIERPKIMDFRFRGNDTAIHVFFVIPTKVGIHVFSTISQYERWILALPGLKYQSK